MATATKKSASKRATKKAIAGTEAAPKKRAARKTTQSGTAATKAPERLPSIIRGDKVRLVAGLNTYDAEVTRVQGDKLDLLVRHSNRPDEYFGVTPDVTQTIHWERLPEQ